MSAVLPHHDQADAGAFDRRNPDYRPVYATRARRLAWMREHPDRVPVLRNFYAANVDRFIDDWGVTADPRNALLRPPRPVLMPFKLFNKQREWVTWVLELARSRESGLTEKSRDCGVSWLAMCVAASLCLFHRNLVVGVGSRTEDKVDRSGDPDCLLWKARTFLGHLPAEFRGSWDETQHSAHMRLSFPETGSAIVGEAGDAIGRGGRSAIYFIDEAAHLERPKLIEASLASNTDCRVDISSVSGMANTFAEKRHSGRVKVFTFHWRDDPRKGAKWYAEQQRKLDPVTLAAEVDISYHASTEGALLPSAWIQSAVGALEKLGLQPSGAKVAALDVADQGRDKNALAMRHGQELVALRSWSGEGSDLFATTLRAFACCDERGFSNLRYDADGVGAGVRGDSRIANEQRPGRTIQVEAFRGSASVADPTGSLVEGRLNRDYFANLKAESWWSLRMRFQHTHRAASEGAPYDPDSLISISPQLPEINQLVAELSQPTYSINMAGKIAVDKAPAGFKSPNLADAVMIAFSPFASTEFFPEAALTAVDGSALELPKHLETVFAVAAASADAVAVVYFGSSSTEATKLTVLDWDLRELQAGLLEAFVPGIQQRIAGLFTETAARYAEAACLYADMESVGTLIAGHADFPITPIPKDVPPVATRARVAQGYVRSGMVAYARPAFDRVVPYRGATRNFLRDAMGTAEITDDNALGIAFASGVLLAFFEPTRTS